MQVDADCPPWVDDSVVSLRTAGLFPADIVWHVDLSRMLGKEFSFAHYLIIK